MGGVSAGNPTQRKAMTAKQGVIEDVRYQDDKCVIHVNCGDGVHTATLPNEDVEKYGYKKGLNVEIQLSASDASQAVSVHPLA